LSPIKRHDWGKTGRGAKSGFGQRTENEKGAKRSQKLMKSGWSYLIVGK